MTDDELPLSAELPRFCREARAQLPALVRGELTGWPARVVRSHVRRCRRGCAEELAAQQQVHDGLAALRAARPDPPADLLDTLLARTSPRGLRERFAVPARGAVSGARPKLSLAFLTVGAVASTGAGWAAWQAGRAVAGAVHRRRS